MKIKICGIFREQDIDYVNEARPDYIGFVFAPSKRQITPNQATQLRKRLAEDILTVGVFVNAAIENIVALYRDGIISLAQLHGNEDEAYINRLKEESAVNSREPIPVIKSKIVNNEQLTVNREQICSFDYLLVDSGAGSGKTFDWNILRSDTFSTWLNTSGKPWFLAGGINTDNIEQAMSYKPFCIDVSGGAETDGVKDRKKIIQLITMARKEERG